MSTGRIFDRPGHPPLHGPPPPGTVLRPLMVTRIAQAATGVFFALVLPLAVPDVLALALLPLLLLLVVRAYNAGRVLVEPNGLRLAGLLRSARLAREQVESIEPWRLTWRTTNGKQRHWQLWPYAAFGIMWPGVQERSDEVMQSLGKLVESWQVQPPASPSRDT